jgi:starvation-inducible DNA-binding protein
MDTAKTATNQTTSKSYRKLGFSSEETQEVVEKLNLLLANYHIHYQNLRNFHWNVTGHDFFDMHEKFEALYEKGKDHIDDIAERIRVFGYTPMSTINEYIKHSTIEEPDYGFGSDEMVRKVLQDMEQLVSFMVDVDEAAMKIGDHGTIDMINGFVKGLEKDHWMLTAFLNEKK